MHFIRSVYVCECTFIIFKKACRFQEKPYKNQINNITHVCNTVHIWCTKVYSNLNFIFVILWWRYESLEFKGRLHFYWHQPSNIEMLMMNNTMPQKAECHAGLPNNDLQLTADIFTTRMCHQTMRRTTVHAEGISRLSIRPFNTTVTYFLPLWVTFTTSFLFRRVWFRFVCKCKHDAHQVRHTTAGQSSKLLREVNTHPEISS